jgi:N-acetylglucosamine-6-sulfatase
VSRKRNVCRFVAAVVLVLAIALGSSYGPMGANPAQTAERPNIVLILTDDLDARSVSRLTKLKSLMTDQGTTFNRTFVTTSLCCPSRASILRGQYPHNHQIVRTSLTEGFEKFRNLGHENSTIATWLQSGGYRTMLLGKYFNEYPIEHVPPGWSEWFGMSGGQYNENGTVGKVSEYPTDLLARKAADFIERSSTSTHPFFIYLAPMAPHEPATPAPRDVNDFPGAKAPRVPSFNETDVSDKPAWVRNLSPLDSTQITSIDNLYRKRLQSMEAVEDMVGLMIDTLRNTGELDNTYIFFTSDNGFHMGEHRMPPHKWTAYEEDIRVPLIVRGPGVPAGRTLYQPVLNNDFAPTFAALAEVPAADFVDGRSFAPLLGATPPTRWRSSFEVESVAGVYKRPAFQAVRMGKYLYVEYATGERELYDLSLDPYQLNNVYKTADPALVSQLKTRLGLLRNCARADCRTAEGGS